MDVSFRDIMLNIELDDTLKYHYPVVVRSDQQRDEYLRVKLKYDVVRIQITGRSSDDVVKQIADIYKEKKDKFDDSHIQKLYSREEEKKIQNIYKGRDDLL